MSSQTTAQFAATPRFSSTSKRVIQERDGDSSWSKGSPSGTPRDFRASILRTSKLEHHDEIEDFYSEDSSSDGHEIEEDDDEVVELHATIIGGGDDNQGRLDEQNLDAEMLLDQSEPDEAPSEWEEKRSSEDAQQFAEQTISSPSTKRRLSHPPLTPRPKRTAADPVTPTSSPSPIKATSTNTSSPGFESPHRSLACDQHALSKPRPALTKLGPKTVTTTTTTIANPHSLNPGPPQPQSRPRFLPQQTPNNLSNQLTTPLPLPASFSPQHRRHGGGTKFLASGLASTALGWVLETGSNKEAGKISSMIRSVALIGKAEGEDGDGDRDKWAQVIGVEDGVVSGGLGFLRCRDFQDSYSVSDTDERRLGDGTRWLLLGFGERDLQQGMRFGVQQPMWMTEVSGERWHVALEWDQLRD
ncbi:hypothetical protein MMC25_005562 [Agyrium rufum]|nr:hypothetical protein [Agyrium rufum]